MSIHFKKNLFKKKSTLKSIIFLKIKANSAITGPPIGATLGQYGIPAAAFCKLFNERTVFIKNDVLLHVSLFLTINGEYKFNIVSPTTSFLFKRSLTMIHGAKKPGILKSFFLNNPRLIISPYLIYEVFLYKKNITLSSPISILSAVKKLKGSLQSMGVYIVQYN